MLRRLVLPVMLIIILMVATLLSQPQAAHAATLPEGFVQSVYAVGMNNPTAMAFAPDGRLFVLEQAGVVRIHKPGQHTHSHMPFITLDADGVGERGLLGIAFDPAFAQNGYVYLYYSVREQPQHNRVIRVTADGDMAVRGSETVIMDLEPLGELHTHNGGAMHFGKDGKLYIAVGENGRSYNAQSLSSRLGKLLRINADGSIPDDNPFATSASGLNRAIYAFGFRNPFTFAIQPDTGRILINDVGYDKWEEINDVMPGESYGWPVVDGPQGNALHHAPIFAYEHGQGEDKGCAITGGTFFEGDNFPPEYANSYFFADYCNGWIRRLDLATMQAMPFISGTEGGTIDLDFGPDGALYYMARWNGNIYRVEFAPNTAPSVAQRPADALISAGQAASFVCNASGSEPLNFQWQRGNQGNYTDIQGANNAKFDLFGAQAGDSGASFRCVVTNPFGSATSDPATLTVLTNPPPVVTITEPAEGTLFEAGQTIQFAGTATDATDGDLPLDAYSWRVDFHHEAHVHPYLPETPGSKSGSFSIPNYFETEPNIWFRVYLTAHNKAGLTTTIYRDIKPHKVKLTINTVPDQMQIKIDGQFYRAPLEFESVAGIVRNIQAISPQNWQEKTWILTNWSDGGTATHDITTPSQDTVYTATFEAVPATNLAVTLSGTPETPQPGQDIEYTIVMKNNGGPAENIVLTAHLLANMSFKSITPAENWTCEPPAADIADVRCSIAKAGFGEYKFVLVVTLSPQAHSGERLVMNASVASTSYDWFPESRTGSTINVVK